MVEYVFKRVQTVFKSFASINGVYMGLEPLAAEDSYKRDQGILDQGDEYRGEKSVKHIKYDGSLILYPESQLRFVPSSVSGVPPTLLCKPSQSSSEEIVGNWLIPHDGQAQTWQLKSNLQYCGGVWKDHLLRVVIGTRYLEYHFTDSYRLSMKTSKTINPCMSASAALTHLLGTSQFGYPTTPSAYGSELIKILCSNLVGQDPFTTLPYVQLTHPIAEKHPYLEDEKHLWSELVRTAVDSLDNLDINSISFLKELVEWKRLLPPLADIRKKPFRGKTWANFYLWLRYGLGLTIADSKEIINALPKIRDSYKETTSKKPTRLRASKTVTVVWNSETWTCRLGLRMVINTYPEFCRNFGSLMDDLRKIDLYPSTANLWDIIPFSFVMDWFFPFQKNLEMVDSELRTMNFRIFSVTQSVKWSRLVPPPAVPGYCSASDLTEVHYDRAVGYVIPGPDFEWNHGADTSRVSNTLITRMIDGAALLLQRRG